MVGVGCAGLPHLGIVNPGSKHPTAASCIQDLQILTKSTRVKTIKTLVDIYGSRTYWYHKFEGMKIHFDQPSPTISVSGHQGVSTHEGTLGDAVATAQGQGELLRESCVGRPGRRG